MTTKIAEAECPNCHAVLDVTETQKPEPNRIRRFLRRVSRLLQLISEIGQHAPARKNKREPAYDGPTCSAFVTERGGYARHILSEGPSEPRRVCGKPAPNWARANGSVAAMRMRGVDIGNTAICDDCAKMWRRNGEGRREGLVNTKNGASTTKNVGATT